MLAYNVRSVSRDANADPGKESGPACGEQTPLECGWWKVKVCQAGPDW